MAMNGEHDSVQAEIAGDRPLTANSLDRLGFAELAGRFATALVDRTSRDGVVVGLEGTWGSGKSSLLSLIVAELDAMPEGRKPVTVPFSPWLIGNRDALLTTLFSLLASAVDQIELDAGNATGTTVSAAKRLAGDLRKFGSYLGALAPAASLASLAGLPGAALAEKALQAAGELSKQDAVSLDLEKTKHRIDAALRKLDRRIIITIDDVDRLEPEEIAEVLRLARSVADFHNVTYVLCYDPDIVAEAVKTAMRIESGRAYLEKIVQVAIRVPAPEPFALRAMFSDGLAAFLEEDDEATTRRLASVVDVEGGRWLKTPRAVNRALDAIRFVWPVLQGRVDPADLIWLQLTRLGNSDLYNWVETYSATMAAVASGRVSLGRNAASKAATTLTGAFESLGLSADEERLRLREFLPGIGLGSGTAEEPSVYQEVSERDRLAAISGRRLASPDHWRLYFALANPTGAIVEQDYDDLWNALDEDETAAKEVIRKWLATPTSTPVRKAEVMLDRLRGASPDKLDPERSRTLITVLADVLDEPLAVADLNAFLGPTCWREAEYLLSVLRDRIGQQAGAYLVNAFRHGSAIGWLTYVYRSETFSHGRHGDQRRPVHEWILTEAEWDEVSAIMNARYSAMGISGIMATPDPLSALYAWIQGGGATEAQAAVRAWVADDARLLTFLENTLTTVRSSSEGTTNVIRRQNLEAFLDPHELKARVDALAGTEGPLRAQAEEMLTRINRSRTF